MNVAHAALPPGAAATQKFLTAREVGGLLRLPLSTVYHLAKTGDLPAVQFGRTWRFPALEIAALAGRKPAKARILVVDDDDASRTLISEVLQAQGHMIFVASDPPAAVALAHQHRFDLLLIDLKPPGKQSTDLICELQKEYSSGQMVIITAFADLVEMDTHSSLGALTVLAKPVNTKQLLECVEHIATPSEQTVFNRQKPPDTPA